MNLCSWSCLFFMCGYSG